MSVTVECPHCGRHHKLEADAAGTLRRCECGQSYRAPGDKPAPPIPSPRDAANRLSPKSKIMLGALLGVVILGVVLHLIREIRWHIVMTNPAAPILMPLPEAPIPELIEKIRSENGGEHFNARHALAKRGEEAVKPLIAVLGDESHSTRTDAIWSLKQIGETAAPDLLEALNDDNPLVVGSVAKVLADIGERRAIERLIDKLQAYSAESKSTSRPRPSPGLSEEERAEWQRQQNAVSRHRGHALEAIAQALGELQAVEAIQPLLAAITFSPSILNKRIEEALVKIGEPAVAPLNEALWQLGTEGKAVAAHVLAQLVPAEASEDLARMVASEDQEVQFAAATALAELKDPRALPVLIAAVEEEWWVANADRVPEAIRLLGELGDPQAAPALIEVLGSDRDTLRALAAKALGLVGDRSAVEPLIGALDDEARWVVTAVATALGQIGDRRAIVALTAVMDQDELDVGASAVSALAAIKKTSAIPMLVGLLRKGASPKGMAASEALVSIGGVAAPALVAALSDDSSQVQRTAYRTLHEMKGDALDALLAELDTSEPDAREQILRLLNYLRDDPRAQEAIDKAEADGG